MHIAGLGLDRISFNVGNKLSASRMIAVQFLPQVVKKLDLPSSGDDARIRSPVYMQIQLLQSKPM